ncbi:hypothetical protein PR048_029705 [Dryococelus australis]|uniref:Uncharacterized protein n=1 Tax=Dryococelus australis TaxID=614101 RepID=A0ABQ9GE56_9NEOP|nr:hypothetical protein PR048_029705 [Dryococelus australis]
MEFDIEITYLKGKENEATDYLSRVSECEGDVSKSIGQPKEYLSSSVLGRSDELNKLMSECKCTKKLMSNAK